MTKSWCGWELPEHLPIVWERAPAGVAGPEQKEGDTIEWDHAKMSWFVKVPAHLVPRPSGPYSGSC